MCTNVTAVAAAPLTIALDCEDVAAAVEDVAQRVQREVGNEQVLLLQLKNTKPIAVLLVIAQYYRKRKKRKYDVVFRCCCTA